MECDSFETSPVPIRIPETRIHSSRSEESLDSGATANANSVITSEHRAGSFSTVPNYDNDDEAWATDDIGQLQVEVPKPSRGDPLVLVGAEILVRNGVLVCVTDGGSDQQQ